MTATPVRLLVISLADIGDLIVTTPALAALRESFPRAHISVLTTLPAASILTGSGLVDQIITFDKAIFDSAARLMHPANARQLLALAVRLRRGHFDTVIILRHLTTRFGAWKHAFLAYASGARQRVGLDNGRGGFLTHRVIDRGFGVQNEVQYWLDVVGEIGATTSDSRLRIGISDSDRAWAAEHLSERATNQRLIAIHPGSGSFIPARRWEIAKFAALADQLISGRGARVVLVGSASDDAERMLALIKRPDTVLNLAGQTTLNQLAAVLSRCDHFVGADSGVLHVAAAAGTHVVALFGPSNHHAWRPWSPTATLVRTGVRCSPCSYVLHTVGAREGCLARTCLKTLDVAQVIRGLDSGPDNFPPTGTADQPPPSRFPIIPVLGLPVHALTFADLIDQIGLWVAGQTPHQICTVNPEFLMVAQRDPLFYSILNRADICMPDGVGLLWAARRLGMRLPERVTGSDGVPLIAAHASQKDWRLFFLGAAPGVAAEAARRLIAKHPGLQVVGIESGSPAPADEDALVAQINASGADILFVAYGAPNQDKWIARNLPRLTPRVAMGVGGSFDFVAGVTRRAPPWMRRMGIEWLHRLLSQPWRWRRMTRLPRFVISVIIHGQHGPHRFVAHPPPLG